MDDCFISSVFVQMSFVPFLIEKPWDYDKTLILRNICIITGAKNHYPAGNVMRSQSQ